MAVIVRRWTKLLPGRRRTRPVTPADPLRLAQFGVETVDVGGTTVVAVTGEVDIATTPQLRSALQDAAEPLVVDLSGVTFMDSTGLATMLTTASAHPSGFAIACPEGPARLLFAVTATEEELPLYASRDEALRAVGR
jgi:anti-sigma B factor antagonist